MTKNEDLCEVCGSDKTYIRPSGRAEWKKTVTGKICKSCASKEYSSRKYKPKPRTPLRGPCVECNSETTYMEKSGYPKWYRGSNGTICKRCWNRIREKVMLPGQCIRCKVAYTHHGWHKTPNGTLCNKCFKHDYGKIERGGLCNICKITKSTSWMEHPEYGRVCKKCHSKIRIREIKFETLAHYSKNTVQCASCGYKENINALELDHIDGQGNKDREEKGHDGGWGFFRKLKKLGFPKGYQVLCSNCNRINQIEN